MRHSNSSAATIDHHLRLLCPLGQMLTTAASGGGTRGAEEPIYYEEHGTS
eukprot:COSAG05_NODE_20951_length_275_cov_1.164773_1_plen_49_part_10